MAHIGRLMEKLEEPAKKPRFIKTIWEDLSKQYGELDMELNKNGRNFLLGTLFKSYLVQTAVCSLIIWVCTDVMDVAVSQIFRKCFGDYFFMYYRSYGDETA